MRGLSARLGRSITEPHENTLFDGVGLVGWQRTEPFD